MYGQYFGSIADEWWDDDITDDEFLEMVGISFTPWDKAVVNEEYWGTISTEEGAEPGPEERQVALSMSLMGNSVKHLKTRNTGQNSQTTPDFEVNGLKTELKTAFPRSEGYDEPHKLNRNSAISKLTDAFKKQGAMNVIYDMRNVTDYNVLDIFHIAFYTMVKANSNLSDGTTFTFFTKNGVYRHVVKLDII